MIFTILYLYYFNIVIQSFLNAHTVQCCNEIPHFIAPKVP